MKHVNKDKETVRVTNRLFKILGDKEFMSNFNYYKLEIINNKEAVKEAVIFIRKYLEKNNIPSTWFYPLYKMLFYKDNNTDTPLHDGIHIKIGNKVLTTENFKEKNNLPIKINPLKKEVCIVITSNATTTEILNFIKKNQVTINNIQRVLELPSEKSFGGELTLWAQAILVLRKQGKSYKYIADFLEEKLSEEENTGMYPKEQFDYLMNTLKDKNNVKQIYKRYENKLGFKK